MLDGLSACKTAVKRHVSTEIIAARYAYVIRTLDSCSFLQANGRNTPLRLNSGFAVVPYKDSGTLVCGLLRLQVTPAVFKYEFNYTTSEILQPPPLIAPVAVTDWTDQHALEKLIADASKTPNLPMFTVTHHNFVIVLVVVATVVLVLVIVALGIYCGLRFKRYRSRQMRTNSGTEIVPVSAIVPSKELRELRRKHCKLTERLIALEALSRADTTPLASQVSAFNAPITDVSTSGGPPPLYPTIPASNCVNWPGNSDFRTQPTTINSMSITPQPTTTSLAYGSVTAPVKDPSTISTLNRNFTRSGLDF